MTAKCAFSYRSTAIRRNLPTACSRTPQSRWESLPKTARHAPRLSTPKCSHRRCGSASHIERTRDHGQRLAWLQQLRNPLALALSQVFSFHWICSLHGGIPLNPGRATENAPPQGRTGEAPKIMRRMRCILLIRCRLRHLPGQPRCQTNRAARLKAQSAVLGCAFRTARGIYWNYTNFYTVLGTKLQLRSILCKHNSIVFLLWLIFCPKDWFHFR